MRDPSPTIVWMAVTLALLCGGAAIASEPEPQSDNPLPVIVLIGEEERRESTEALMWAISSQLADLPVLFHTHWITQLDPGQTRESLAAQVAQQENAQLVVWSDLDSIDQISMHFADPDGGRVQSRGLASAGEGEDVRFETIAVIARAAVGAVVSEGRPVGPSVAVAADPAPPAPLKPVIDMETPTPQRDPVLALSVGYGLKVFSTEHPIVHGPDISGRVSIARRWDIFLGYTLHPGIHIDDPAVELLLTTHDIRIGLAHRWPVRRVELSGSIAAELGLHDWNATALTNQAYAAPDGIDRTVGLQVGLMQVTGPIRGPVWGFAALRLSAPLLNQAYDVTEGDELRTLLTPWMVQPTVVTGLVLRSGK